MNHESKDASELVMEPANLSMAMMHMVSDRQLERSLPNVDINDSALMDLYLNKVAPMFCCYGGDKNPFHQLVAKAWYSEQRYTDHAAVIWATQSLAATFMLSKTPGLVTVARSLHQQARDHLELVSIIEGWTAVSVLALVLLAHSAMYIQDSISCVAIMNRIQEILESESTNDHALVKIQIKLHDHERRFFWDSRMYFEMFSLFTNSQYCQPWTRTPEKHFVQETEFDRWPHPFTGASSTATYNFLAVGQLVRRQRRMATSHAFASRRYLEELEALLLEATALEEIISSEALPIAGELEDPQDQATPLAHLIKIAECYRDSALLQLYRVFPDLLSQRLGCDKGLDNDDSNKFLSALALSILEEITSIPVESGTTPFQAVLLLSVSGELRMTSDVSWSSSSSSHNIKIVEARTKLMQRLTVSQREIPGQRLYNLLRMVRQVWARLDNAGLDENIYWLEVVT